MNFFPLAVLVETPCTRLLAPDLSFYTQSQQEQGTEGVSQLEPLLTDPLFHFQRGLRVHFHIS